MSWCDKLASTPTVGFRLSTHFAPIEIILDAWAPILDRASEDDAKNTTVEQPQTFYGIGVITREGFKYSADESKISVAFQHRTKVRATSGGPPRMEMLSTPMPFTALMPVVEARLIEATLLLPKAKDRSVQRVGVISTTAIAEEDLPPGIKRFVSYVGRPWKADYLDSFNITITADISVTGGIKERCVHTIAKSEDKEQLMTLQFDWQRLFDDGWQITQANLERVLQGARKGALAYFEDLAEGNRFDEILISSTT